MNDPQGHNKNGPGLSRRDFLRGSGVAAAASALATAPLTPLAGAPTPTGDGKAVAMGPAPVKIKLSVNGKEMTTSVEPRVTLLDALRDYLDVTGCKRVCDRGTCGACTVMLDGKPVYSCSMLALEAQGKAIKTAEALVADGKLDAVPAAFVHADAQQCGYCTPGFVMATKGFLDKHPNPTMDDVKHGLGGNLCRCGTYVGIRKAVLEAAREMKGGKNG